MLTVSLQSVVWRDPELSTAVCTQLSTVNISSQQTRAAQASASLRELATQILNIVTMTIIWTKT